MVHIPPRPGLKPQNTTNTLPAQSQTTHAPQEPAVPISSLPPTEAAFAEVADQLGGNRDGLLQKSELLAFVKATSQSQTSAETGVRLTTAFLRALLAPVTGFDDQRVVDALRGAISDGVLGQKDWELLIAPALAGAPGVASNSARALLEVWGSPGVHLEAGAHEALVEHLRAQGYPIGMGTPRSPAMAAAAARENVTEPDADFAALSSLVTNATGQSPSDVLIGVTDSGLAVDHRAFQGKVWRNPHEQANGYDDDGNGFVDDIHGANIVGHDGAIEGHFHGTHVAGIATRGTDKLQVVAAKIFDAHTGATPEATARGLSYPISQGARVVNMSFGGSAPASAFVHAARDVMARHPEVLFVVAAGNDGSKRTRAEGDDFFANIELPNVIVVAAGDEQGRFAERWHEATQTGSVFGETVTLGARGSEVYAPVSIDAGWRDRTSIDMDSLVWTRSDLGYAPMSGTSMAAPLVSNVSAKMMSLHPSLRPADIKRILVETGDKDPGWTIRVQAGGVMNEAKALREAARLALVAKGIPDATARAQLAAVAPPPTGSVPRTISPTFMAAWNAKLEEITADKRIDVADVRALLALVDSSVGDKQLGEALRLLPFATWSFGAVTTMDNDAHAEIVRFLAQRTPNG